MFNWTSSGDTGFNFPKLQKKVYVITRLKSSE